MSYRNQTPLQLQGVRLLTALHADVAIEVEEEIVERTMWPYEVECNQCPGDAKSVYVGESSRNLYTRGSEHAKKYEIGKENSFLTNHQVEKHHGAVAKYSAKVTGVFKDACPDR